MFDIETYAMCKNLVASSGGGSGLTANQAVAAVIKYFDENPDAIVSNSELETALANYQKTLTIAEKQSIADLHQDKVTSVNGSTGAVTIDLSAKQDKLTDSQLSALSNIQIYDSISTESISNLFK